MYRSSLLLLHVITGEILHHQKAILPTFAATIFYHVQLRLIVELALNVNVIFLSKYFRNKWRRVDALACWWRHHKGARVVGGARDAWVLRKGVVMIQIDDMMRWRSGRQLKWRWCRLTAVRKARCLVAIATAFIILLTIVVILASSRRGAMNIMQFSHVLLQIKVTAKSFGAYFTLWMKENKGFC